MLSLHNVAVEIKGNCILKNLSFELQEGVYGLLGPNGAGKTTLMRCIAGIIEPKQGNIWFNGKRIYNNQDYLRTLGYLPQKFGFFPNLTAYEALEYMCVLKGIKDECKDKEINRVLDIVDLSNQKGKKIKELSGGMLRRIGIAQAFMGRPNIILFDEPTSGLDPEERLRYKTAIANIGHSCAVVMSTHIVEDLEQICDTIIVMDDGIIKFEGPAKDLVDIAKEKVYVCLKKDIGVLDGKRIHIVKEFIQNGEKHLRLLSPVPLAMEPTDATLEDGYLCLLKNV